MADETPAPVPLTLRYAHALGDLAPFFDALKRGELMGTRCGGCDSVWMPPRLLCSCGGRGMQWERLSGEGVVVAVTLTESALPATERRGPMGFALVQFDGAGRSTLVRFAPGDAIAVGRRVRLQAASSPSHPIQALVVGPA